MVKEIETVIVGGGQAGLATSYFLKQNGREHIVLEQSSKAANAWRNDRWDSFTLLTPNWSFQMPGAEYKGDAPDGFMPREEIVSRFEQYIQSAQLPVSFDQHVISVTQDEKGHGYWVNTTESSIHSHNVVMATGLFQKPRFHLASREISSRTLQLHSGQYRNPQSIPSGAILVVGSAQSGCQIAEELYLAGRKVYLSIGACGRVPRRYRGKDVYDWMRLIGWLDRQVEQLPSPKVKFAGNPHVSGRDGGRTLNLHKFYQDGVILLGHIRGAIGTQIGFYPDVKESLSKSDKFETDLVKAVDDYIQTSGLNCPPEKLPELRDGYEAEEVIELDLQKAGITTIIWATGYDFDFSLVHLPVIDADKFPIQHRGITRFPGLYFVGLPWLYKFKSGHLLGVREDAEYIASSIINNHGFLKSNIS